MLISLVVCLVFKALEMETSFGDVQILQPLILTVLEDGKCGELHLGN